MAKTAPTVTPDESPELERPSRLRSAWSVLRGQRLTPRQIQFEWLEYQQIFESILQRLSASMARQARSEKLRLAALVPESSDQPLPEDRSSLDQKSRKAELRSRSARLRGLGGHKINLQPPGDPSPPPPEN